MDKNDQLNFTYFGNQLLRNNTDSLTTNQIKSNEIQRFIIDLKKFISTKNYGIGIAAPQVGKNLRIAIIFIRPTKSRPNLQNYDQIIINPEYKGLGKKYQSWEGCLSSGKPSASLFAQVPRYKKIEAVWLDENCKKHSQLLEGLPAHVFQHETDHLNGILFVDKVVDTKTYMIEKEYRKIIKNNKGRND